MSADQTGSQRESQLSAMFDGELPEGECELVARRLAKDENLRRSWDNYSLIGAVMRSEPLARRHLAPQVAAIVQAEHNEIATEPDRGSVAATGRLAAGRHSALRWAGGFGVAAAVGAVAIFFVGNPQSETIVADAAKNPATAPATAVGEVVAGPQGDGVRLGTTTEENDWVRKLAEREVGAKPADTKSSVKVDGK
mgnify:CR=1 FL=1